MIKKCFHWLDKTLTWQTLSGCAVALAMVWAPGTAQAQKKTTTTGAYSYSSVGDVSGAINGVAPRKNIALPAFPSFALMGGGPDVDEGFRWMIRKAGITPTTRGRLVIIRTAGDGAYNPYVFYSNSKSSTQSASIVDGWVGGASEQPHHRLPWQSGDQCVHHIAQCGLCG